jgi:hypothetical protein
MRANTLAGNLFSTMYKYLVLGKRLKVYKFYKPENDARDNASRAHKPTLIFKYFILLSWFYK